MHRLRETLSAVLGLTCICTAAAEGKVRGGEAYFSGGYPEETVADTLILTVEDLFSRGMQASLVLKAAP